ncbi:hypothetical protein BH20ACI2_BH20ACI2_16890 [soil metagenome]
MKILLSIILCLMIPTLSLGQEPSLEIPSDIKTTLDKKFPGWKFAEVDEYVRSFLRERVSANARPEMIMGDFDGNGKADYAVLIKHGKALDESGKAIGENVYVVAFLKKRNGHKLYVLNADGDTPEYLTLGRRGEQSYDHHANKKFTYANDSIEGWIFEKAGWTYVYEKGKFRYIYTLD